MRDNRPPHRLRLASYNIRKCRGLDFRRRPQRTLDVIAGLQADVVALQEADHRLGNRPAALPPDMVAAATGLRPVKVARNTVSIGWHGNALLVRDCVTVENVTHLDLPSLEPRGAIIADLHKAGRPFRVVAAHLGLTRRHRGRQLQAIEQALKDSPQRPTIILGDFNEWSDVGVFGTMSGGFSVHIPGPSYPAIKPLAPLDRFLTCPATQMRACGVGGPDQARHASDHLPVWADVELSA